jgi:hypothetical protein
MPIYINNLDLERESKETLFKTLTRKQNYENIFSDEDNSKLFELKNDKIFYGKIDDKNNHVMLNTDYLLPVNSNDSVVRLCDVAAIALNEMQEYFASGRSKISTDSFYVDLYAQKGYSSLNFEYSEYLKPLYRVFTRYINNQADRKLVNINNFFDVFVTIAEFVIKNQEMPFTRTGFLASSLCPPTVSGLVVDLFADSANDDNKKYNSYIKDSNYPLFVETARKFNFIVDKNLPWRLYFNVTDESLLSEEPYNDCGIYKPQGYFRQFEIESVPDFFNKRYYKTMIGSEYDETTELYSLKSVFLQMYNTYVVPNKDLVVGYESQIDGSVGMKVVNRNITTLDEMNAAISQEKWLKLLLYLRALETKQKWNQTEYNSYYSKTVVAYKNYGLRPAIDFINACTRNILDVDRTSTRMINRSNSINKMNLEPEGFRF